MKTKKVCPFCGFNNTQVVGEKKSEENPAAKGFQTECINCGARGPCGMVDHTNAIKAWDNGDFGYRKDK